MLTLRLAGGFANQLFQYACGYSLAKDLGQELVLDISNYTNGFINPYQLDALNIEPCRKLDYRQPATGPTVYERLPQAVAAQYDTIIEERDDISCRGDLIRLCRDGENIYLAGFWQKYYMDGYEDELLPRLTLKRESLQLAAFREKINSRPSVAVHVRGSGFLMVARNIGADYYKAAIAYMLSRFPDARFYIFTDDVPYAKGLLADSPLFRFVHMLDGLGTDLDEFFALSACDHHIITPMSSYSLWGVLLNLGEGCVNISALRERVIHLEALAEPRSPYHRRFQESFYRMPSEDIARWKDTYGTYGTKAPIRQEPRKRPPLHIMGQDPLTTEQRLADIACDAYACTPADFPTFLCAAAAVAVQKGEYGRAARFYDKVNPAYRENASYQRQYAAVLRRIGRAEVACLHDAVADRVAPAGPEGADKGYPRALLDAIYLPVREMTPRHFICAFLGREYTMVREFGALAVFLKKMGHMVSGIRPPAPGARQAPDRCGSLEDFAQALSPTPVYYSSYVELGIGLYDARRVVVGEQLFDGTCALIQKLAKCFPDVPATVVTRTPVVFEERITGVSYIFVDSGEWELDHHRTGEAYDHYAMRMVQNADRSLLVNPRVYASLGTEEQQRCTFYCPPCPQMREKYVYTARQYPDFMPPYMDLPELVEQAAVLSALACK